MTTLEFGKYRGWSILDIPIEYVLWLLAQRWFVGKLPELYQTARGRAMRHYAAQVALEDDLDGLV